MSIYDIGFVTMLAVSALLILIAIPLGQATTNGANAATVEMKAR
jgi:hypothetical protein